jgi:hypothetical protein
MFTSGLMDRLDMNWSQGSRPSFPHNVEHRFRVIGDLAAATGAFLSPARDRGAPQSADR